MSAKEPMPFKFDYAMDANGHPQNIYCRSDHANYARYGIPGDLLHDGRSRRLSPGDGRAGVHPVPAHGARGQARLRHRGEGGGPRPSRGGRQGEAGQPVCAVPAVTRLTFDERAARSSSKARSRSFFVSDAARSNSRAPRRGGRASRADPRARSATGDTSRAPARRAARRRAASPAAGPNAIETATARFSSTTGDGTSAASAS